MAPSAGTLRVGRYFAVLLGLFVVLYAIVAWPGQPKTPKLGLDLEGGAQVILKAQTANGQAPSKSSLDQAKQIIENRVNGLGVANAQVVTQGNDRIVVSVPGASGNDIKDVGSTALLQFRPLLPIFNSSGQQQQSAPVTSDVCSTAVPSATPSASGTAAPSASAKASSTAKATSTASASPSAHGRVVPKAAGSVSPSPTGTAAATSPASSASATATGSAPPAGSPAASNPFCRLTSAPIDQWKLAGFTPPTTATAIQALQTSNPTEFQTLSSVINAWPCDNTHKPLDDPKKPIITCDTANTQRYLLGPVIVAGTQVKTAAAIPPGSVQGSLEWTVNVDLKPTGQAAWASYTAKHNEQVAPGDIANVVADTLDSKVIVASTIQSTINGTTQITGLGGETQATNLANSLKYGALPLNFSQEAATSVSPTLGTSQLKAGLLAGGIGLFLVIVYSLLYYRALGLVTIASLAVSGGLTYAMLVVLGKQIGFTLTLAGIAGFIVAVGITADSFVVFFERIKDEVHEGRTARSAVPRAWDRARRTILSADFVSLLAAAILYYFAAGDVKGFAFTLGLSTVLDLIVVFLFTHPLISLASRSRAFGSPRFSGLSNVRRGGIALSEPAVAAAGPAVADDAEPEAEWVEPAKFEPVAKPPVDPARRQRSKPAAPRPGAAPERPTDGSPASGSTAAERAAARRGRNVQTRTGDTSSEDEL